MGMVAREEKEVVSGGDDELREVAAERREGVKWEEFLPRVMLVESDDATRQIIAALLRKCGYRVTIASDGLKAWETLKEKSHNIDLVLTEMELPSISGFALLTMIMEHEACKKIPVIMMSSHDSMSTVFKCTCKGASDFLIKPVRKNELRNLWQHVWRRHTTSGQHGSTHEHQDENLAKRKLEDSSREHKDCTTEYQMCREKGSDAQSSCTKSDMEAESIYPNMLDNKQLKGRYINFMEATVEQTSEKHVPSDGVLLTYENEPEDKLTPVGTRVTGTLLNGACTSNKPIPKEECTFGKIENLNEEKPSKEVIDLIGAIDNQQRYNYVQRNITSGSDASETHLNEKDFKYESKPALLKLSSRRYQQSGCEKSENDEWNPLNHSNSSAFCLYNGRSVVPSSTTRNFDTGSKECASASVKALSGQDSGKVKAAPCCSSATPDMDVEATNSLSLDFSAQEGLSIHCSPLRLISSPAPIRGLTFDPLCAAYNAVTQPLYFPQAAHPFWTTVPLKLHKAAQTNSTQQASSKDLDSMESHHQDDQRSQSEIQHPVWKNEEDRVQGDDQRHASYMTGESVSSSICDGCSSHVDIGGSGCGSLCGRSEGSVVAPNISEINKSRNVKDQLACEGISSTDFHCLTQREEALNKFRLKRKDRCYEKKVRYQSRKRLAEQRPRVKGQFVRQMLLLPDS